MDFTKAVKMLKDGECEGIKSEDFGDGGYYYVLCKDGYLRSCDGGNIVTPPASLILTDWVAVGEKPKMETVEVTGWVNVYDPMHGAVLGLSDLHPTKEIADAGAGNDRIGCKAITLPIQRPVPRPVERSITVTASVANGGIVYTLGGASQVFHYHPETNGKTGVVTFTWEETPKGE